MYEIVDSKNNDETAIRITEPPFENLVVRFGKIGIKEDGDRAILAFDYDVLSGNVSTEDSEKLGDFLGDILVDILENHFDEGEVVGGDD